MDDGRKDRPDEEEQQDSPVIGLETRKEVDHGRFAGQIHLHARGLEHAQCEEQETETEKEIAQIAVPSDLNQDNADEESRPDDIDNIEGESCRHDPGAHRGADIGAHDDRNGLGQ